MNHATTTSQNESKHQKKDIKLTYPSNEGFAYAEILGGCQMKKLSVEVKFLE